MSADLRQQLQATLTGSYTVERELGGGGMSRVFVATDTALRRAVVVKVLPPELVAGLNVERFRREILLAAGLQHAHIVPVLAAGETNGLPWFTMPFVDGESLRERVARGPLPISESLSILRDVARALAYAHSRGVVHRDIKPDNVLLSGGSAVVTDFGIAKALSASRTDDPGSTRGGALTQLGTSIGTPAYMAPEQAAADPSTDARADIYSFGCMAYELLAGRPPFIERTPQRLLAAQMAERPQPIGELRPDTPLLLAQTVMACLEKDADSRPQSASDLVKALDLAMTTSGSASAAPSVLLGRGVRLRTALGIWLVAFFITWLLAKAAIVAIGLPNWVLPGALIVMALGVPVILFTAFVHRTAHRALTRTPTLTPGGSPAPTGTMATIAMKASPHVSWRRTVRGGVFAFTAFIVIVAAFMIMRAMGIGPAASLFAAGKLNERDKLLVSDFTVGRGDSSLIAVVNEAVRTSLGQSSVLSVLSPGVIAGALQRMQRPVNSRLDVGLAREVAVREGAKAVVSGDVTPLGGGYIVTMRLVSADSGAELASFHETADSPKELLPTLDRLSRQLREKAGESLKSVHGNPPLDQVTTASLDALRKYAEAVEAHDVRGDFRTAVTREREAIALDTNFAMAYRKLSASAANANMGSSIVDSAITQAYRHRDHLTERERLLVEGRYYEVTAPGHDRRRAIAAYETLLAKYPNDLTGLISLGRELEARGEFARADSLFRRAAAVDPTSIVVQVNRILDAIDEGRLAEAADSVRSGRRRGSAVMTFDWWMVAWAQGAIDSTTSSLSSSRGSSNETVRALALEASSRLAEARGRLREAARIVAATAAFDSARGAERRPLEDSVRAAENDALFLGQSARSAGRIDAALARYPLRGQPSTTTGEPADIQVAIAYARAGRPDRARAVLAQLDAAARDTSFKRWIEPFSHEVTGEIALAEDKPRMAIDEFRLAGRRPDGPAELCFDCHAAQIGLAFDRAGQADSAVVALERYATMVSYDKLRFDARYLAGTYRRLGELYEERGNVSKAITYTQKFIELWKNADPELQPKVVEARQRLARLTKHEAR
jgi:eukaryotic-like serine/threonine-protein kinase